MQALTIYPVCDLPEITAESDLPQLLIHAVGTLPLKKGDILALSHKILSKAEGYTCVLEDVMPSATAEKLAELSGKDPHLAELVLRCSRKVYACARGIWIAARRDGWICCNAGVDQSNSGGGGKAVLLPENCDAHAARLSGQLSAAFGFEIPVVICDTQGRVLRNGAVGVAVGSYGLEPLRRYTGEQDRDGRFLMSTCEAVVDELAGAATVVMGQGCEGIPAAVIRGYHHSFVPESCEALQRQESECIFEIQGVPFEAGT